MGLDGCAVTSAAMVAAYFGSTKNPGQLCETLDADGGLDSHGSLSWGSVPYAAGGTIRLVGDHSTDLGLINQQLDGGNPVIAQVTLPGGINHWVVLTGHDGGTYYINDSWYGDRSTINARYGNPATAIHSIIMYQGRHTPPPAPPLLALVGSVSSPSGPYLTGDRVPVVFTVKNTGGQTGTWTPLIFALRDPAGNNRDVVASGSVTLSPGASSSFTVYLPLASAGTWTGWVSGKKSGQWFDLDGKPELTLAVADAPAPSGQHFSDVAPANPYFPAIETMAELQVLAGYPQPDGSAQFHPEDPLLRAQMAKLLCEAFALQVDPGVTSTFTDLGPSDSTDPLYPGSYVAAAQNAHIVEGKNPTLFDPWGNLTRAQMVTVLVRAIQRLLPQKLEVPPSAFTGALGNFDPTHAGDMRVAEFAGLLQGLVEFGPTWNPWAPATRAEVAQILYRWKLKAG